MTAATTAPLQLAYGISNILNYQADTAGVDFSIRGRIEQQLLSFSLILNNASFVSLAISYMVTARPEVFAGSYIADTNQLIECGSQLSALIPIPVPATLSLSSNSLAMLVFLNGMRTQAWLFNLKLQQYVLDTNKGLLNVTVLTDAIYPIETLFFSYLIIDLTKLGSSFTYAFTTASQPGDFTLSGLVALTNSTSGQLQSAYVTLNKTNKLSCTGFTCSKCISASSCTSNNGVVAGTQCVKCGNNQVFQPGTGCVCAIGYYIINGACGTCSQGAVYLPVSQSCISCGKNAGPVNGACACNTGFYNISGSCRSCAAGTIYSALLLNCTSICIGGQQWINGACSCPGKTYLISGTCGTCPVGYSYYSATTTCSQICNLANQISSNGQCLCAQGYTLTNGACKLTSSLSSGNCGANQYLLNGVCKCLPNFIKYQDICYPCPANSVTTVDQLGCICNPGYNLTSFYTCVLITYSTTGSSPSNNQVVAPSLPNNFITSSSSKTINTGSSSANPATYGPASAGSLSGSRTTSNGGSASSSTGSNIIASGSSIIASGSNTVNAGSNNINTGSNTFSTESNTITTGATFSSGSGSNTQSAFSSCPTGMYQSGTTCQQCSNYCLSCFTNNICIACSLGFQLVQGPNTAPFSNSCNEACGDGSKMTLPCDDGNTISGDGCSNTCSIEPGWTCSGGSGNSKDVCVSAGPSALITVLQRVGIVNAVYQNVLLESLPTKLTADDCPNCKYLLNATLVSAPANTAIESKYIPRSQYQYVVTAITPNSLSTGTLIFTLQLNSTYASDFSPADMAQKQTVVVDLSTISMYGIQPIGVTNSATNSQE